MYTNRDLEELMMTGGFTGLDRDTALSAIVEGTTNVLDDKGFLTATDPELRSAMEAFYLTAWSNQAIASALEQTSKIVSDNQIDHDDLIVHAFQTAGIPPQEYVYAKATKDGGDPSDMLRIYSKFIERC